MNWCRSIDAIKTTQFESCVRACRFSLQCKQMRKITEKEHISSINVHFYLWIQHLNVLTLLCIRSFFCHYFIVILSIPSFKFYFHHKTPFFLRLVWLQRSLFFFSRTLFLLVLNFFELPSLGSISKSLVNVLQIEIICLKFS